MSELARVISNKTVEKFLTPEDVIKRIEDTWKWYGEGKIIMPPKITTDMEPAGVHGWFNSMPSYIGPAKTAGIKVVGGYSGNRKLGLPYIKANILLTDPDTGVLRALIGADWISNMRTGAQPAIMGKYLAAKTDVVTIIGAGLQGWACLLCMSKTMDIREVRVCDIRPEARESFIARFAGYPFKMVSCATNEEGCRGSDIIITITTADAPLIREPWIKKGALVMTMGSFTETDADTVLKADVIATDHIPQTLHRGNLKVLVEAGKISADSFDVVVPDLIAGKQTFQRRPDDRVCANIVGMGCLDVSVAALAYERIAQADADTPVVDMD